MDATLRERGPTLTQHYTGLGAAIFFSVSVGVGASLGASTWIANSLSDEIQRQREDIRSMGRDISIIQKDTSGMAATINFMASALTGYPMEDGNK